MGVLRSLSQSVWYLPPRLKLETVLDVWESFKVSELEGTMLTGGGS